MNKKYSAIVVIALVSVGLLTTLYIMNTEPLIEPKIQFHFEDGGLPSELAEVRFFLSFMSLDDCNISITSIPNASLLYSLDIELYELGREGHDFSFIELDYETKQGIGVNWFADSFGDWRTHYRDEMGIFHRMKSLNLTIGSSALYSISINGIDLSTNISLQDGVKLGGMHIEANGTISITLRDDIIYTNWHTGPDGTPYRPKIEVKHDLFEPYAYTSLRPEYLYLTLELPALYEAELSFSGNRTILPHDDWDNSTMGTYSTSNYSEYVDLELQHLMLVLNLWAWNVRIELYHRNS